jgi:hypothetical protein
MRHEDSRDTDEVDADDHSIDIYTLITDARLFLAKQGINLFIYF